MATKAMRPAIEGGRPVRDEFLPFARPAIAESDIARVVETLRSGWLTVGPRTKEFEKIVAEYIGVEKAAALHSCTAGLHLSLAVLGVGPGDEVVMPALNFAAGPNMAIHLDAKPVLVDIDPETLNVTPEILEAAITPRTKVLMPLHFAGRPCDMGAIMDLARSRGLKVVGDGAHAIGSDYGGAKVGSLADATSFSFYVTKGITTGEGGIVTSPDRDLIGRVRRLSLHGMSSGAWKRYSDKGPWYYEILEAGFKYNMNDMQAALGLTQMERVDVFRTDRERIASAYSRELANVEGVTVPAPCLTECVHAWHLYPIQLDTDALTTDRNHFVLALLEEGIGVSVHFIPIHYHPFFRDHLGHEPGAFPATERYFERAISLPIYPTMTDDDVADVVAAMSKLLRHYKR